MLLKSISVTDFRQFKGEQTVNFSTSSDKNVTVIMGENGAGKTTFAQAFMWCLYGETDFSDKAVLCKATAQDMIPNSEKIVRVELKLTHKSVDYVVVRQQVYRKDSAGNIPMPNSAKLTIAYKNKDGQQEFVLENQKEYKIKEILPKELSRYFFFDGERIGNMSKEIQSGKSNEFAEAVKSLLGLDSYVASLYHLKGNQRTSKFSVIGSYNEQYDSRSDSRIAEKTNEINAYTEQINKELSRKSELEERIPTIEEECDKLKILIEENKDSEELAKKKNILIQNQQKTEEYISGSTKGIMDEFHKYYHNYFSQKLIAEAIDVLASEDKLDKGIPDIHKRTIDYLIKQGRCICGTPIELDNEAHRELMKLLQFIPPQSLGTMIGAFAKECKTKAQNSVNLYKIVADKLSVLREKEDYRDNLISEITGIEEKLSKLQSVGAYQAKLSSYNKQLRDARDEISQIDIRVGGLETQKDRAETERRNYSLTNENNKKIELYKAYAEYIYDVLKNDYATQEAKVRNELEKCINDIFKTIYAGGLSLNIDEKYNIQTQVDDFDSFNQGVETSTAQSISIIFAFIAGVIKMARHNDENSEMLSAEAYPLVMDAPLSAFDKARIQTVCETLPGIAEQVIIFIKDTDGEIAEKYLSDKIGKNYSFDKKNEFETYLIER